MPKSIDSLFLALFNYRERTASVQAILISDAAESSDRLWQLYSERSYLPDNVAWSILNIFTHWQDKRAKDIAIKLWREGKTFTIDLMTSLQKTTGNSLSNSSIWQSFITLETHEIIDELQILETGFEVLCHCDENRKQRLTFTLRYDEAKALHGMSCTSHCGLVSEGNLEAIEEVAKTIDYAELKTKKSPSSSDHEVTLERECETEDLNGTRLLAVVKAIAQTADNLEKQLIGLDIDWKKA